MESTTGILLEGGAMRGIFSAGVLDCLMENDIHIPNVLAVSAGAYAGMNYMSGQKGRILDAVVGPLRDYKYMGFGTFLKKGTFFDMDYLFKEVPKSKAPFDFQKFSEYPGRFLTSTINMHTDEVIYHEKFKDEDEFFTICQAANSLAMIADITHINGIPMMDGGMADAIPVKKALAEGWEKLIIVLTREADYRKKPNNRIYNRILRKKYAEYPQFVKAAESRHITYNEALDIIADLEAKGKAFVFRPVNGIVSNSENNVEKLTKCYRDGYAVAAARLEELKKFLEL